LLEDVQLELDIVRKPGDTGPYFCYSANFLEGRKCPDPNTAKVLDCINNIKDCMIDRAKLYADTDEKVLRINQLDILAWMTSGSKKHPLQIKATKNAVVLLSLGCNVTLNVTSRSKKTISIPREVDEEGDLQGHVGCMTKDVGDDPMEESTTPASPKKLTAASKRDKLSFSFSLVHGDILVFFGDEFEYSIKRHGTSFLLIGS